MQIVIDISPEAMDDIKNGRASRYFLENKILNGTPLPAGHGRLIDADALMDNGYQMESVEIWYGIKHAPTIIEADKESK